MAGIDKISIEILADGTIKSETSKISGPNHQNAEAFMKYLAELTGGETKRTRRGHTHVHGEEHEHEHDHAEAGHKH